MNTYSVKHRLASCTVDLDLIARIEKFIIEEAKDFLSSVEVDGEMIGLDSPVEDLYHVFIQTKTESLKYSSISEYTDDFLPDSVHTIILDFNSFKNAFLNIRVLFHSSFADRPVLEIYMNGHNLKETCAHFADGIKKIVNTKRNTNHWFHNRALLLSLLFVYALWNVANFFMIHSGSGEGAMILSNNILYNFLFALLTVWIIISIFVRPFITFNTRKQNIISLGYNLFSMLYLMLIVVLFYNNFNK